MSEGSRTATRSRRRWARPLAALRRLGRATRPADPAIRDALARRWAELPTHVRTAGQALGRVAVGCEGTHGVFPRCNLACTPCYLSRDANRVAVDGGHTVTEVRAQMDLLRQRRGPHAHAQLIGGEVSLLRADDHAAALLAMREAGREPMSMTNGDFDDGYLRALVLGPDGKRRLRRVSFAAHFDMLMFGRRGIPRPPDEASLDPYRRRFAGMFARLRREHRVRSFIAHNMTVTPRNIDQIAGVIARCHGYGYGLFSFQPAAFVGDERRWHGAYRAISDDEVWAQIERGAGTRLPYHAVQTGDLRCNRTAYGFYLGERWTPVLDEDDPADLRARDAFFTHLAAVNFTGTRPALLAIKLTRLFLARPWLIAMAAGWAARTARRAGPLRLLVHRIRPVTFVMHSFIDAADVAPAWDAMQRGQTSDDPRIRAAQERLAACAYTMAHPETGQLVPACVQHSVLDPAENAALRRLLPLHRNPQPRAADPPARGGRV